MSYAIPQTSLSGLTAGQTGTVDWTSVAQSIGFPDPSQRPHIQFYNESPCELQLNMQTGEQFVLPAGGWQTIELNPNCTHANFLIIAVLNAAPIVALLLGTWYAPGETVPAAPILGNSPIGASVTASPIANALEGVGQSQLVTEVDNGAGYPMLGPAVAGQSISLFATDNAANHVEMLNLQAGTLVDTLTFLAGLAATTNVNVNNGVNFNFLAGSTLTLPATINSQSVSGQGVPLIVATYGPTVINSTAQQTLINYTPSANGLYRANIGIALNNGTSGQAVLALVGYSGQSASGGHRFSAVQNGGTSVVVLDGTTSRTNGDYACQAFTFYATTASAIQIIYRDPANTPNDTVSACLERLI